MNFGGFNGKENNYGNAKSREGDLREIREVEGLSEQRRRPVIEEGLVRGNSIASDGYGQTKKVFGDGYER